MTIWYWETGIKTSFTISRKKVKPWNFPPPGISLFFCLNLSWEIFKKLLIWNQYWTFLEIVNENKTRSNATRMLNSMKCQPFNRRVYFLSIPMGSHLPVFHTMVPSLRMGGECIQLSSFPDVGRQTGKACFVLSSFRLPLTTSFPLKKFPRFKGIRKVYELLSTLYACSEEKVNNVSRSYLHAK